MSLAFNNHILQENWSKNEQITLKSKINLLFCVLLFLRSLLIFRWVFLRDMAKESCFVNFGDSHEMKALEQEKGFTF